MFEICVEHTFAAGHALRNYHGKCENVHGHNYRVQVAVSGPDVDENGKFAWILDLDGNKVELWEPSAPAEKHEGS